LIRKSPLFVFALLRSLLEQFYALS
jgi:hypothetical protein